MFTEKTEPSLNFNKVFASNSTSAGKGQRSKARCSKGKWKWREMWKQMFFCHGSSEADISPGSSAEGRSKGETPSCAQVIQEVSGGETHPESSQSEQLLSCRVRQTHTHTHTLSQCFHGCVLCVQSGSLVDVSAGRSLGHKGLLVIINTDGRYLISAQTFLSVMWRLCGCQVT